MKTSQKRQLIPLIILLCIIIGIGTIALTIGIFDIPDSYFYLALGRYFYTGMVTPIAPYNMTKPQTLFGPIYGLLTYPLFQQRWPVVTVTIPFVQLSLLFLSAYMIYVILKTYYPKPWPMIGAILFILLPFNLLYSTFFMSEILTQFFLTCYLFVLHTWIQKKLLKLHGLIGAKVPPKQDSREGGSTMAPLVCIASIMTLTRYAFVALLIPTILMWLYTVVDDVKRKINLKRTFLHHIVALMGIGIVILWMQFNWHINGIWQLSPYTGRHLYDNVVKEGKFLPPLDDPTLRPFRERLGNNLNDMFRPWWDSQLLFKDNRTPEVTVDTMMWNVSIAAILHNPIAYTLHVITMAYRTMITVPYHTSALVDELTDYAGCVHCPTAPPYNHCWRRMYFTPPVQVCTAQSLWGKWVQMNITFYPIGAFLFFTLACIGIVAALTSGNVFFIVITVLFIFLHLFQSATEQLEGRFIIPLYPLYAMLITLGFRKSIMLIRSYLIYRHSGLSRVSS